MSNILRCHFSPLDFTKLGETQNQQKNKDKNSTLVKSLVILTNGETCLWPHQKQHSHKLHIFKTIF